MKRTTVGRFWGYVSVFIALTVSLAGNVTAALLHQQEVDPSIDPSRVDIGFAGLPPLAAFLVIELVNHNPWVNTTWGPKVMKILLAVVAPGSAVVSFLHLVTVVVHDRVTDLSVQGVLTWVTAILTALLIDGLMFGGTAALLLPKSPASQPSAPVAAIGAYPDWREEIRRQFETSVVGPVAPAPTPPAAPRQAPPVRKPAPVVKAGQKRFPPRQHPLWAAWVAADRAGAPWSPERMVEQMREVMGRTISVPAAATMIGRWEKALEKELV